MMADKFNSDMQIAPDSDNTSLVLRGEFNPAIIQPWWLFQKGLFSKVESDEADFIVNNEVTQIDIGDFLIKVQNNRYEIRTEKPSPVLLADKTCRLFGELLPETPLTAFGTNREIVFDAGSDEARDYVGRRLAPRDPWGEWGEQITKGDGDPRKKGGLRLLVMEQSTQEDREAGYIQARVQPVEDSPKAISLAINDHYDYRKTQKTPDHPSAREIMNQLYNVFEKSIKRSEWIVNQIMRLAAEGAK